MKTPYIVGELRLCVTCGGEFPRAVHRTSYCPACQAKRRKRDRERAKERAYPCITQRGPRGSGLSHHLKRPPGVYRTHKNSLPFCPICHRYNGMCEHQMVIYG